jgi:hypothetical protein
MSGAVLSHGVHGNFLTHVMITSGLQNDIQFCFEGLRASCLCQGLFLSRGQGLILGWHSVPGQVTVPYRYLTWPPVSMQI